MEAGDWCIKRFQCRRKKAWWTWQKLLASLYCNNLRLTTVKIYTKYQTSEISLLFHRKDFSLFDIDMIIHCPLCTTFVLANSALRSRHVDHLYSLICNPCNQNWIRGLITDPGHTLAIPRRFVNPETLPVQVAFAYIRGAHMRCTYEMTELCGDQIMFGIGSTC